MLARWTALFVVAAAAACAKSSSTTGCQSNTDCPASFQCNHTSGVCQLAAGCETSFDCPSGTFCDTANGNCVDNSHCTEDIQCPFDEICDTTNYVCISGCYSSGDCNLGQICQCSDGTSLSLDGGDCPLGECISGFCQDETDCNYGDLCVGPDGGPDTCQADTRGPFCGGCSYVPGQVSHCDGAANFCLLDRKVDFFMTYCGVNCSQGQSCPFGYSCQNVVILTNGLCQVDTDCAPTGGPCTSDSDCEGARCDADAGACAGICQFNEDSLQGFCTCTTNSDCPQDTCDTTSRTCSITQQPCTLGGDECANAIYCSKSPGIAACYIGANCKPALGLTCQQTLAGTPVP